MANRTFIQHRLALHQDIENPRLSSLMKSRNHTFIFLKEISIKNVHMVQN